MAFVLIVVAVVLFAFATLLKYNPDLFANVPDLPEVPELTDSMYLFWVVACVAMVVVGIVLLVKKSKKRAGKSKLAPEVLFAALFLIAPLLLGFFLCYSLGVKGYNEWLGVFDRFVWKNFEIILIAFVLLSVLSVVILFRYDALDTAINSEFCTAIDSLGFLFCFLNFYAPYASKGPLVYREEDRRIAFRRKLYTLATFLVKFVCGSIGYLIIAPTLFFPLLGQVFEYNTALAPTLWCTGFAILLLPSLDFFLYYVAKSFNFVHVTGYVKTTRYYADGDCASSITPRTNFIAFLLLGFGIFLITSGWFFLNASKRICRIIETDRILKAYERGDCETVYQFYS